MISSRETNAINITRFLLVIGVLFIHFRINIESQMGITVNGKTDMYDMITSGFFLRDISLNGLFLLSGYLFFATLRSNNILDTYILKIDRRISTLVIPFLFWNCIWIAYEFVKTCVIQKGNFPVSTVGGFLSLFWAKGYTPHPDMPIAGYTWFLRDLFVFALFSPVYQYFYSKRKISILILCALFLCEGIRSWHFPYLHAYIYLGGLLAYNKITIEKIMNFRGVRYVVILAFLLFNVIYYMLYKNDFTHILMTLSSISFVLLCSWHLYNIKWLVKFTAISTYLYVTHVLVLNFTRNILAKIMIVTNDEQMVLYYFVNALCCLFVCISSYYIFKLLHWNKLLSIMTGGRS